MESVDRRPPATSRLWWAVLVLVIAGVVVAAVVERRPVPGPGAASGPTAAASLDPMREIPAFSLVDQAGASFRREDLLGRVWVADFIFTFCAAACPAMTSRMAAVQETIAAAPELRERVRLISFSVDPERDTPEQLKSFAKGYGADPALWRFVTGAEGAVAELCQEGFLLSAGSATVAHSDRFVLIDHQARIRGYYRPSTDEDELARLIRDLRALAAAAGREAGEGRPAQ
jgi:cytochrome oxidase Cu insertion factor (SCO1/SenC/PrrC family)